MKTATLKVTALVPGILLVLISLYLNFAWRAELGSSAPRSEPARIAERVITGVWERPGISSPHAIPLPESRDCSAAAAVVEWRA